MINKSVVVGLVVVIAIILGFDRLPRGPVNAQERGGAAQKWEYFIVLPEKNDDPLSNQEQLDKLGNAGWELCIAHSSTRPSYFIFKKPK